MERGYLVSPMGDTATTQHQRDWHDLASLLFHLQPPSLLTQVFLFPDRTDPGVNTKMLRGQDLAELICLYMSNSHQI